MTLLPSFLSRLGVITLAMAIYMPPLLANTNNSLSINAVIANKGLGCEMVLPETVLQFIPLQTNQLTGAVKTFQIKPLVMQLSCVDETESILPTLTLLGTTPYVGDAEHTVFLDGTPNGVGFMVRQSADNSPIGLADFYRPSEAIGNNNLGQPLTLLDDNNHYQAEKILWVGMVGPLQSNINSGRFHASLTLNVAFQ
ncbi:fimbrial protein [Providencia sneebia]|uniref:Putative fimbrial-like protein n=1 Tax=Providencia sneebia DSM 19967 TaxID=1141660 RepID=K8WJL7_9GAMM|nr:fimbrial protein [Providencia sneebia]EKT60166.1 putative fimbrial-like protein [Providencia sneebia DSM 19967]